MDTFTLFFLLFLGLIKLLFYAAPFVLFIVLVVWIGRFFAGIKKMFSKRKYVPPGQEVILADELREKKQEETKKKDDSADFFAMFGQFMEEDDMRRMGRG